MTAGRDEPIVLMADGAARKTSRAKCDARKQSQRDDLKAPGEPLVPMGAGDGPIKITRYDRAWHASFIAERERLASLLPGVPVHHIGSTAVRGLAAKPVIDMIALVDDLDADSTKLVLRAGYHLPARFNANLDHRRFLCHPTLAHRTHHLHLVDTREGIENCLRFRDRLRADPELADEYAALKRALASRFQADRQGYTEAKSSFIADAIRRLVPKRS